MHGNLKPLKAAIVMFFSSLGVGIIGFMLIEGYSLANAFYMAVITIGTVGFTEVHELSSQGRVFTSLFILLNLGIFAYTVSTITRYVFEGELKQIFTRYKVQKLMDGMENHVIVCGYGRNGSNACAELIKNDIPVVVIEQRTNLFAKNGGDSTKELTFFEGDATQDDVLLKAGIENAKTIITTMPNDADNVFITLTAKELNKNIKIISRGSSPTSYNKLIRAGADHVVMPDNIGGHHMASLVTKPEVIEFVEMISGDPDSKFKLEEFAMTRLKRENVGRTIKDLNIRMVCGAMVIAVKVASNKIDINPHADTTLPLDSVLILLGKKEDIEAFRKEFVA